VYKAVDPIIDRTVAIKTINLNLSKQELEEYEQRFQQEIKAAGRLNHPNIVTIYDVGKTDQCAYMAMEFLEGQELKDIIASGKLLTPGEVVDITAMVADGLWFAHQQDIVHRDVKPSNIMVMKGGVAKITDFGIARLPEFRREDDDGPHPRKPALHVARAGHRQDDRRASDIFSLGVVLFEALTACRTLRRRQRERDHVRDGEHHSAAALVPQQEVPAMLDLIVAKAMAKLLEDRYQTIKEFADDLREVRRQMDSGRPAAALKASTAPPTKPAEDHPSGKLLVDTATFRSATRRRRRQGRGARGCARDLEDLRFVRRHAAPRRDDRPDRGFPRLHHQHAEDARLPREDRVRAARERPPAGRAEGTAEDGVRQPGADRHAHCDDAHLQQRNEPARHRRHRDPVIAVFALAIALIVK
jgi:hypothetical protein